MRRFLIGGRFGRRRCDGLLLALSENPHGAHDHRLHHNRRGNGVHHGRHRVHMHMMVVRMRRGDTAEQGEEKELVHERIVLTGRRRSKRFLFC